MRIVVTGGNSGLGKATAAAFAAAGHQVTIACRTLPKGEQAAAEMPGDVEVRHLDLADLSSIRASRPRCDPLMCWSTTPECWGCP
jgi:NAD(P)-dependent dehydrogenase (short-subunit alcohol dehydrogenase family)